MITTMNKSAAFVAAIFVATTLWTVTIAPVDTSAPHSIAVVAPQIA